MMGPVLGSIILGMDPVEHRSTGPRPGAFSRRAMVDWSEGHRPRSSTTHISTFEDAVTPTGVRSSRSLPGVRHRRAARSPRRGPPGLPPLGGRDDLPARSTPSWASPARPGSPSTSRRWWRSAGPTRRHDVISTLATAEIDGGRLTDQEIVDFLRFLLEAGAETTYRSSSNLLFARCSPDQTSSTRCARPRSAPAGNRGSAALGASPHGHLPRSCNRRHRARRRPHPGGRGDRGEPRRRQPRREAMGRTRRVRHPPSPHSHITPSGSAPHICLGMHLARAETLVVLNAVLDRLPNIRLDPAARDIAITGSTFRAPRALPVLFDVASRRLTWSYDYIIIGGGSAGCVMAAALSEERRRPSAAPGGRTARPESDRSTSPPAHWPWKASSGTSPTSPIRRATVRRCRGWPVGYSAVGAPSTAWSGSAGTRLTSTSGPALGCDGWDYESVLPFFKRAERYKGGADHYSRRSGPQRVQEQGVTPLLNDAFEQAAQAAGYPLNDDYNGEVAARRRCLPGRPVARDPPQRSARLPGIGVAPPQSQDPHRLRGPARSSSTAAAPSASSTDARGKRVVERATAR